MIDGTSETGPRPLLSRPPTRMQLLKLPITGGTPPSPTGTRATHAPLTPLSRYLMLPEAPSPEEDTTTPTSASAEQNHRLAQRVNLRVVGSPGKRLEGNSHRKGSTLELSFNKAPIARDNPKQSILAGGAISSLSHLTDGKDHRTRPAAQSQERPLVAPVSTSAPSGLRKISFGSGPVPQCSLARRLQEISPPAAAAAAASGAATAAAAGSASSASAPPEPLTVARGAPASPAASVATTREARSRPSTQLGGGLSPAAVTSPAAAGGRGASPAALASAQPGTTIATGDSPPSPRHPHPWAPALLTTPIPGHMFSSLDASVGGRSGWWGGMRCAAPHHNLAP